MSSIRYEINPDAVIVLTLDAPRSPVNLMSESFRHDLHEAVKRVQADLKDRPELLGVIINSAKSSFFAGADLKAMLTIGPSQAASFFEQVQSLKADLRTLEKLGKPVVALIQGSALGGGLELALACHHRIAVNKAGIEIGFPEASLGLLPGAGGLVKTVRLKGLQAAVQVISESKRLSVQEALDMGWITQVVASEDALMPAALAALRSGACRQVWDDPKHRIPGGGPSQASIASMLSVAPAMLVEKTRGNFPAQEAILAVAVEGAQVDFETALRIESRWLTRLATGQVAKNMIQSFFFHLNEIKADRSRPQGEAARMTMKLGILGAGMMGSGIAWAAASRGMSVVLKDVSREKAEQGKAYSARLLAKRVESGRMSPDKAQSVLQRIQATDAMQDLSACDMVIEAVYEDQALKAKLIREALDVLGEATVFASNTSTIPITELAKASARPEQFIGVHFFSPVEKMPLIEIIRGKKTNDATLAKAYDFVKQIGKTPIVVNDARGFYTSRVFSTYVNEGMALLGEGVSAARIENIAMQFGMPVGPLAVLDEVSLKLADDVLHQELDALAHAHQHDHGHDHSHNHQHDHGHQHKHHHPHKVKSKRMAESAVYVLEKMAHGFKRLGRAAGAGFYEYPEGEPKRLWEGLSVFMRGAKPVSDEDIRDRLSMIQSIETLRCLQEQVLEHDHDANIGSIMGWGFPAYTGGTLQFIHHFGPQAFLDRSLELQSRYGERFSPPALLHQLAKNQTS
ncbi:MAG: 3-hydroxyacyl-CoA dehydrogenase [Betaproteobacteria bacterium]|nr:3-hydroxyacyl-CoA dehydrogenase [Betaproteobacteria bacterium]